VSAHQDQYPITTMCHVLCVSTSGYYAWLKRTVSKRAQRDVQLTEEIKKIHTRSKGTYGAPRIHERLAQKGIRVGRKRVARLMKAVHLQGVSRRKSPGQGRKKAAETPLAPDLVERDFSASGPDQLWVADITYIPTWGGWLYLAVVVDAWSRRVVGWAMTAHLRTELVERTLAMAVQQRHPGKVIHHSDQGKSIHCLILWETLSGGRGAPVHGLRRGLF
jgi:putative transposase